MNRSFDPTPGERLGLIVAFLTAVLLVALGLFFILQKGAPISAPGKQTASAANPQYAPVVAKSQTSSMPHSAVAIVDPKKGASAHRCLVNGTVTYSDSPCPGGKLVDVTPSTEGFLAQRTLQAVRKSSPEPAVADISAAPTAANEQQRRAARCVWILAEIDRIDAQARHPLSASMQDWLRETRRKLVDERYELKC